MLWLNGENKFLHIEYLSPFNTYQNKFAFKDERINDLMLEWSKDEDFQVRRIAIDHQLCRKEKTNTKLLEAILVNNFGSNKFFINKAIVWSLRDYSKANFELVKEFVEKYKEKWTNNVGLMNGLVIDE